MDTALSGILNGRVPGRSYELFKLTSKGIVYRLVYVTLLNYVRGTVLQGTEGMLHIGFTTREAGVGILITKIEWITYLILLEPEESWLVNNRINIETWNMLYD